MSIVLVRSVTVSSLSRFPIFTSLLPPLTYRNKPVIGIAHLASILRPWSPFDVPAAIIGRYVNTWYIPDRLHDKLDFLGLNYYGQVRGTQGQEFAHILSLGEALCVLG